MSDNPTDYKEQVIEKVKENYLSVALGFLVFLVAVTLIFRSTSETAQNGDTSDEANQEESMEGGNVHVVQAGESVSSIARDVLGSLDHTQAIIDANNLANPELIEVGDSLTLPAVGTMAGEAMEEDEDDDAMMEEEDGDDDAMMEADEDTMEEEDDEGETSEAQTGPSISGDEYTVQTGDTLMTISERAYGEKGRYIEIMQANGLRSADRIEAGMVLELPR